MNMRQRQLLGAAGDLLVEHAEQLRLAADGLSAMCVFLVQIRLVQETPDDTTAAQIGELKRRLKATAISFENGADAMAESAVLFKPYVSKLRAGEV